jgi:hypothetical protein
MEDLIISNPGKAILLGVGAIALLLLLSIALVMIVTGNIDKQNRDKEYDDEPFNH